MRKTYNDFPTPQAYAEHILNTWVAFCEVNTGIAQLLVDLLNDNAKLRAQLAEKEKASPKAD